MPLEKAGLRLRVTLAAAAVALRRFSRSLTTGREGAERLLLGGYFTAFPMMWGPTGNHLKGGACHSISILENRAFSRSFQVSLVRWQPSPMCFQVGSKTCCHSKAQLPRGSATCSQKKSSPPWEGVKVTYPLHLTLFVLMPPSFLQTHLSGVRASGLRDCGGTLLLTLLYV